MKIKATCAMTSGSQIHAGTGVDNGSRMIGMQRRAKHEGQYADKPRKNFSENLKVG
jgi:hypothetical protein